MHLRILHKTTLITQMALIGILVLLLIQIVFLSQYYTLTLIATSLIVNIVSAVVTAIACLILISWYRFNRGSYVVLIFAVAFATNAYIFVYTAVTDFYILTGKNQVITPQSEVVYPSDTFAPGSAEMIFSDIYKYAATWSFVLLQLAQL